MGELQKLEGGNVLGGLLRDSSLNPSGQLYLLAFSCDGNHGSFGVASF